MMYTHVANLVSVWRRSFRACLHRWNQHKCSSYFFNHFAECGHCFHFWLVDEIPFGCPRFLYFLSPTMAFLWENTHVTIAQNTILKVIDRKCWSLLDSICSKSYSRKHPLVSNADCQPGAAAVTSQERKADREEHCVGEILPSFLTLLHHVETLLKSIILCNVP